MEEGGGSRDPSSGSSSSSSFHSLLSPDDVVDCFGPSPNPLWRVAQVVEARQNPAELRIHFDGLESSSDEWFSRESEKIAPFKTKTGSAAMKAAAQQKIPQAAESAELQAFRADLKVGTLVDIFSAGRWAIGEVTAIRPPHGVVILSYQSNQAETFSRASDRIALPMTKSNEQNAQPPPSQLMKDEPQPSKPPSESEADLAFGASLGIGDFADVHDTEHVWRLAEIIRADGKNVMIHYVGWQQKWDEFIPRNSPRLQPPRTKTQGDTGPKKRTSQPMPPPPTYHQAQGHVQAQAFAPSRPTYDCFSQCRWKRVLSTGLGHREIESLDKLFLRCCAVQDDYQEHLLAGGGSQIQEFVKKLSDLEAEIATVGGQYSGPQVISYLAICSALAGNLRISISDEQENSRRVELQNNEEFFMKALARQFQFIEIPADGNCLFAAIGLGNIFRKLREEDEKMKESAEGQNPSYSISPTEYSNLAKDYRDRAIEHIVASPIFQAGVAREILDSIGAEDANATSRAIVAELRRERPDCPELKELAEDPIALSVYARIMGTPGIYGTGLELEALSDWLKVPIQLFYRSSDSLAAGEASGDLVEIQPAHVVGGEFPGPPIRLAFYMGNKHYNLIIDKNQRNPLANKKEIEPVEPGAVGESEEKPGEVRSPPPPSSNVVPE